MKIIGVIPARKESKSIVNKNIFKINGKNLIEYTFIEVKKSILNQSYIVTNSKKIKKIASSYGINCSYERPSYLSKDTTSLLSNLLHFYEWLNKSSIKFDYFLILQPTSPMRSSFDINSCIKLLKNEKPDSLFSVNNSAEHPYESIKIKDKKWSYALPKAKKFYRRQDFDFDSYFINGAIYAVNRATIKKKKIIGNKHIIYKMPKLRSFDVNDYEDIEIIEKVLK